MNDVVVLKCLVHNKELFVGSVGGVMHYSHDNGPCTVNNSFMMSSDSILYQMAARQTDMELVLKAAYVCSLKLRKDYYYKLAEANAKEVKALLTRIVGWMDGAHNEKILAWELGRVFDRVVFENLMQITDTAYATSQEKPVPIYRLPKLEMVNIKNDRMDNSFLEIEAEVQEQNKRLARFMKK